VISGERLAAGIDRFIDAVGRVTAWSSFALALVMGGNVLLRYGFNTGSVWSQELEWHLLAPLVLFGMTYALQKGDHVRVDVLYARYPPRAKAVVDLVAALLAVAVAGFIIRYSIAYVQQSYAIGEISADPGGLTHRWVLKAFIPLGFAVFAVQAAAQGVAALLRITAPETREP
jgi:TRAP-type mannitol/chloroaromatic compound transport system permease small subunit